MIKLLTILLTIIFFTTTNIYTIAVPASSADSVIDLNQYRGKKMLIVNTATNSIYTPQCNSLEQLYQQYKESLVVIAVPSNSFGNEPDSDSTIVAFLTINYHISFPLAAKSEVNGDNVSPLYNWLADEAQNGVMTGTVKGDFYKYLIDENGNLIGAFAPSVDPVSEVVQSAIRGE